MDDGQPAQPPLQNQPSVAQPGARSISRSLQLFKSLAPGLTGASAMASCDDLRRAGRSKVWRFGATSPGSTACKASLSGRELSAVKIPAHTTPKDEMIHLSSLSI